MKKAFLSLALVLLFAGGFLTFTKAQIICPQGAGKLILDNTNPETGKIYIRTLSIGEKASTCVCKYKNTDPLYKLERTTVNVTWIYESGQGGVKFNRDLCDTNFRANSIGIDPRFIHEIRLPAKAVKAEFYSATQANLESAKNIAWQLIAQVEGKAAFCKNATGSSNTGGNNNGGVQPGNMNSCVQQLKQLTNLEQRQWAINRQIRSLPNHSFNENAARDSLSHFSLLTAAIKTDNATGNYNGEMYTELNRLKNDPAYRAFLAKQFGISPDMPAITITRSIRDHYAAKIDYFRDRAVFIQRYNTELGSIERELTKLHQEIAQRQCPGDYDMSSCNLTGNWTLSEWDDEESEWYPEAVTFLPVKKGVYSTFNKRTGRTGEAIIAGRELVYLPQPGYYRNYRFVFGDNCNASEIVERHEDYTWRLKLERTNSAANFFIQDQLVEIAYNGLTYQGLYKKQADNSIPIDVFYFRVLHPSGYHIEQDGQRLWGRFFRKPSTDHPDQSIVQWWFMTWSYGNDKWVEKEKELATPPTIR